MLDELTSQLEILTQRERELRAFLSSLPNPAAQTEALTRAETHGLQENSEETSHPHSLPDPTTIAVQPVSELDAFAEYQELISRIREIVEGAVVPGATVAVISKGDPALIAFPGREGWHFPRNPDGVYAGYYPANGTAAIVHLEELRDRGANYLLLPSPAFWWLDHYGELREYLEARFRIVWRDDRCLIYDLRP